MNYYKVFVWNHGSPNYWIGKANSKEDAIKRSDRNPDDIYDVWLLDDWIENCSKRLGIYVKQESE
jgi:hypothetical protein